MIHTTEPKTLTQKRVATVPFLGGQLEIRNAFDYPERTPEGAPTGNYRKARSGIFICLPGSSPLDVSGLVLDEVLAPGIITRLKQHKLAQQILKENLAANEA